MTIKTHKIYFTDKPLSLIKINNGLLVSTADGKIYLISQPYRGKQLIYSNNKKGYIDEDKTNNEGSINGDRTNNEEYMNGNRTISHEDNIFINNPHDCSPIGAMDSYGSWLFFGDWNGTVYRINYSEELKKKNLDSKSHTNNILKLNLGNLIIKCLAHHNNNIYISMEQKLIILSLKLEVVRSVNFNNKVLCLWSTEESLFMGMSVPAIFTISEDAGKNKNMTPISENIPNTVSNKQTIAPLITTHQSSILGIYHNAQGLWTASADKTLRLNDKVLYQGSEWIRIIRGKYFCDGRDVKEIKERNNFRTNCNNLNSNDNESNFEFSVVLRHNDYVVGIEQVDNFVFSIGLDRCMTVVDLEGNVETTLDEEDEIRRLNELY